MHVGLVHFLFWGLFWRVGGFIAGSWVREAWFAKRWREVPAMNLNLGLTAPGVRKICFHMANIEDGETMPPRRAGKFIAGSCRLLTMLAQEDVSTPSYQTTTRAKHQVGAELGA